MARPKADGSKQYVLSELDLNSFIKWSTWGCFSVLYYPGYASVSLVCRCGYAANAVQIRYIWNNFAVCITWVMLDFPLLFASVVKQ